MTEARSTEPTVIEFREQRGDPWYKTTVPSRPEALVLIHRFKLSGWHARIFKLVEMH